MNSIVTVFILTFAVIKFREFYTRNKNSAELKITDPDDIAGGYFAVEYNNQWHRVEPHDERWGEAIRVSSSQKAKNSSICFFFILFAIA